MKPLTVIKTVFGLVGLALFGGALVWGVFVRSFVARAHLTEGTVVRQTQHRSSESTAYYPVFDFVTPEGRRIEVESSTGTNPPSYSIGERVDVLYLPDRPEKAKIRGVFSLWGGPMILGGVGFIFFSIGGGLFLAGALGERKRAELRQSGMPVQTAFQTVRLNASFRVNGRSPFQVVTQWLNPATGRLHVFHSENLWFDPTAYVAGREITVYLDRNDPKNYTVDLSFLPQPAD